MNGFFFQCFSTEVAASLAGKAASINVICRTEVPLERTLGPKVGAYIKSLHESKGVQFEINAEVTAFSSASGAEENDKVQNVHLTKVSDLLDYFYDAD